MCLVVLRVIKIENRILTLNPSRNQKGYISNGDAPNTIAIHRYTEKQISELA